MKEMTLRDVQLFTLDILKDVHEFCMSNEIRYSLAYGTLLGAVRHKGFIPWDDDIDIVMPRPDYERFCKTYKSNKWKLYSPLNEDCYLNYSRVCDLNKTWVMSLPWCKNSPTGLWIDIFPIDGINEKTDHEKEYSQLSKLFKKELLARGPMDNLLRPMPFYHRCKSILMKMLFFWTNIKKNVGEYGKIIKSIDYGTTEWCGNKSILVYYNKEKYPTSLFDTYVDIIFEGIKLKAICRYDDYLRTIYGDYMQLPPEDKRIRHPQKMYWR